MTDTQIPPQWTPTEQDVASARLTAFARWVERRHGVSLPDYHALWRWSVDNLGPFWQDVWETGSTYGRAPTRDPRWTTPRCPGPSGSRGRA